MKKRAWRSALLLVSLLLGACSLRPPPPPPQEQAVQPAGFPASLYRTGISKRGRTFRVLPAKSELKILVHRGGRFARLGHNHVMSSKDLRGYLFLADELRHSRADLYLPVGELVVDDPALRVALGADFATLPSPKDIAATRRNMLGPKVLDATHHPFIWITARAPEGNPPFLTAQATLRLHGVERSLPLSVELHETPRDLTLGGHFSIEQSDFNITPFSVLLGALTVQDRIEIDFRLVAERLTRH